LIQSVDYENMTQEEIDAIGRFLADQYVEQYGNYTQYQVNNVLTFTFEGVDEDEIPLTPLEPAIPVDPEEDEIPLTPLEPAIPVDPEEDEIPLTPLEPATPVEPGESGDNVETPEDPTDVDGEVDEELPKTGVATGSLGLGIATILSGLGLGFVGKKRKEDE